MKNTRKRLRKDFEFSGSDTDNSDQEESRVKSENTLADYSKDPKIKAAAMQAGQMAAKAAIISGHPEKARSAAQ